MPGCSHDKIRATATYTDNTKEYAVISLFCDICGAYLGGDEVTIDPDS